MSNKPFKSKPRIEGPLRFLIEWFYDDSADVSHLGKTVHKPSWTGPMYDRWTDEVWVNGMWYDRNGRALTEHDYEDTHANANGNRHEFRYIEGFQHSGTAESFAGCAQSQLDKLIAEHSSLDQANRSYIFADADRLKALWNEHWWMTGCVVTLTVDGEELAQSSLWNIESDSDESYLEEVEEDRISECKQQALAQLPKTIDRLNKLRRILKDLVPKALKS